MDHPVNPFSALILAGLILTILMPGRSMAQSESMNNWQKISLVNAEYIPNKSGITFNLQFETDSLILSGKAETYRNGYDSLHLVSFEVLAEEKNQMKIKGYLINKQSKHKLLWISAVNFTTTSKDITLISGSYIQFAAYNKLENAERGLDFFDAFDLDIVYVGDMYKLVLPYDKKEFVKAMGMYKNYNIWRVDYEGVRVVREARNDILVGALTQGDKANSERGYN